MNSFYPISKKFLFIIFFIYLASFKISAQDSLYLVGTITGESNERRITDVKGVGDINGDGYDDFMVSERTGKLVKDEGIVKLYLGSEALDLIPDLIFHYPGADNLNDFGTASGIGDINNDGYDDFAISGIFGDWGTIKGKVFIYYGGETIDTIPVAEFNEPWIEDSFGKTYAVGDINKDGYDDFIITSTYNWTDARGRAYLFWGGDTISWERCSTFTSDSPEDLFGGSVANIGDINKDGFDDIAISAMERTSLVDTAKVYIYYGGNPMDNISDTILVSGNAADGFGRIIKNAGDLNKDNIVDFCIMNYDSIYIYLSGIDRILKLLGYSLDSGGDINNDAYQDLIVGNNWEIEILFGEKEFNTSDLLIIKPQDSLGFSGNISFAGDLNNDEYDEVFAHSINWPEIESPLGKVYIYSYKKITDIKDFKGNIPSNFGLFQNYPNPFNPATNIQFILNNREFVTLKIFDVLGKEIATLINEEKAAGKYEIKFDASKFRLSSGVYFYQLKTYEGGIYKKMVLLR